MGFDGIEKYIDGLYNKRENNNIFRNVKFNELKFVIDGIQLAYSLVELYQNGQYGGNYDTFYEFLRIFFQKIKSSIEVIIFKTVKDSDNQKRLEKYIQSLKDERKVRINAGLFNKSIFIEILTELNIKVLVAFDHWSLISYANGHNPSRKFYTILSKDSIFNTIDLKGGYLSLSYANNIFKNYQTLTENTEIPIFCLKNFLSFIEIGHDSWIYFCLLNGYKEKLLRNSDFIGRRNFKDLLKSMKSYENFNIRNNFQKIRSFYNQKDLSIIDELIRKIKFQINENPTEMGDDFDEFRRFIYRAKEKKEIVFPCLVEDFKQPSVFKSNIMNRLYREIYSEIFSEGIQITEFYRFYENVSHNVYTIKTLEQKPMLKFLEKFVQDDNMSLFLASICFWIEDNKNESLYKECFDALLINFMIINFKLKYSHEIFQSINYNQKDIQNLVQKYDEVVSNESKERIDYRKVVHLINKFQAFFYTSRIFSIVFELNWKFLSPRKFLNGYFVTKYVLDSTLRNEINQFEILGNGLLLLKDKITSLLDDIPNEELNIHKQMENLKLA